MTEARAKWRAPLGAVERGVREALANAEATGAPWAALLLAVHYGASFAVQLGAQDAVDRFQLAQVLSNLLRNGIEAIEEQGEPTGELAVSIGAGAPGWLEVSVQDSGKGIAPDRVDAIFAPFFSTKPGGTGLGLAVSRRLVESFGGRLWVEPSLAGATLRFSLPRSPDLHGDG